MGLVPGSITPANLHLYAKDDFLEIPFYAID